MKTYTFQIKVPEGNDEFWEGIANVDGINEVKMCLLSALYDYGFDDVELEFKELVWKKNT